MHPECEFPVFGAAKYVHDVNAVLGEKRAADFPDRQRLCVPLIIAKQCGVQSRKGPFGDPTDVALLTGKSGADPNLAGDFGEILAAHALFVSQPPSHRSDVNPGVDVGPDPFYLYVRRRFRNGAP
jgi:hypothetical protein